MKTLEEHNEEVSERQLALRTDESTGYACDDCGAEMMYRNPKRMNMSNPPSYWADCPACGVAGLVRL